MATLGGHCVRARSRLARALIIEPQRQRPSQRMQLRQDSDPRALQSGRPIATLEPAGKAKTLAAASARGHSGRWQSLTRTGRVTLVVSSKPLWHEGDNEPSTLATLVAGAVPSAGTRLLILHSLHFSLLRTFVFVPGRSDNGPQCAVIKSHHWKRKKI